MATRTTMTNMGGLGKPISRRGAPAVRRANPYVKINDQRGGALCVDGRKDSPFVSSYEEDKRAKRRRQARERIKRLLIWGSLALAVVAAIRSRSSNADESALRGGSETSAKSETSANNVAAPAAAEPPPPPPEDDKFDPSYDPSIVNGKNVEIDSGLETIICGTAIATNLTDPSTWNTPFTPLLGDGKVPTDSIAKEVILLKKDDTYGNLGAQLGSFFHAYDMAHDKGRPLYITRDSWAIDTLKQLFFNKEFTQEEMFATMEKILRVKIVDSKLALEMKGIKVPDYQPPLGLFYTRSDRVNSIQVRNHRETLLRQLLQYPKMGHCALLKSMGVGSEKFAKYAVIHINDPSQNGHLAKLSQFSGKDHKHNAEMQPEYVKNILKKEEALDAAIFPLLFKDWMQAENSEPMMRLAKDPELTPKIRHDAKATDLGQKVYMALLADIYLGNPADQLSLWIARMRSALDIGGNYVLTEKWGEDWVSYVSVETHLELYDNRKLGPWMG